MNIATHPIKRAIQRALRTAGYNIYRLSEEERKALAREEQRLTRQDLETIFGAELPWLQELRQRYAAVALPVAVHSVWGGSQKASGPVREIGWGGLDLRNFRGHGAYVWGHAGSSFEATNLKYYLYADAVKRKDAAGLLQTLEEDGAFGCATFDYAGLGRVSRDLLDSVVELNFLQKHLNVLKRDDLQVLDVGAGYGRLAHRMLTANPRLKSYTCVDAVPESTFLCQFYLKFRGLESRSQVIPLHEVETQLDAPRFNLALNIHSFSECTYAAIEWWLRRLQQLKVPYLMIVPNDPEDFLSMERDRSRRDYSHLLSELGYQLLAREPVFEQEALQSLLGVRDNMFLFQLRS